MNHFIRVHLKPRVKINEEGISQEITGLTRQQKTSSKGYIKSDLPHRLKGKPQCKVNTNNPSQA